MSFDGDPASAPSPSSELGTFTAPPNADNPDDDGRNDTEYDEDDEENATSTDEEPIVIPAKRKRGRPRKLPKDQALTTVKRTRGRPRKDQSLLAETSAPKKPRGRPRKEAKIVTPNDEQDASSEEDLPRRKKKPGPKPKKWTLGNASESRIPQGANLFPMRPGVQTPFMFTAPAISVASASVHQPNTPQSSDGLIVPCASGSICPDDVANHAPRQESSSAPNEQTVENESETYIIPPANRTRILSDQFNEGNGSDPDNDEEDDDDEDDHPDPGNGTGADDASNKRPPPSWVIDAFKAHLEYIKGLGDHAYAKMQSFWCPRTPTFFLLQRPNISPWILFNPRFFFWDPLLLIDILHCPTCHGKMTRHQHSTRPRRVVDFEDTFWLFGPRYRCIECSRTHQSWDPEIMKMLPPQLASEFPARLSHRSGVSNTVFAIMRCCFQNGLGPKQFSDILHILHRRHYEMLEIQYLQTILSRHSSSQNGSRTYEPFPPFDEKSDKGIQSGIPSGKWCREMYDLFIEFFQLYFHQHTSMLSARVFAIDHSFKICKMLAKILGQVVFSGLLTITNEYGEIKVCDFVPTKAHSQFASHLAEMRKSLEKYGLLAPECAFTDNIADKTFLEVAFPSLRAGVVPLTSDGNLDVLVLPAHVDILVQKSLTQFETTILSLIDTLSENEQDQIVIGLDTEWSVDIHARRQGVPDRRQTATVQIAVNDTVWILQLTSHIASGHFPPQLATLLANPRVIKVGKNINQDLRYLHEESKSRQPFTGGVDVAHLAKEMDVIANARISLADLCAKVLKKHLPKDPAIRVSPDWDSPDLTRAQKEYAALDAWASLQIYKALTAMDVPTPLSWNPLPAPHTDVLLFQEDRSKVIARGQISPLFGNVIALHDISITKTRTIIRVTEVFVSSALMPAYSLKGKEQRPLSSFGSVPFDVVCQRGRLKTYVEGFSPPASSRGLHSSSTAVTSSSDATISEALAALEASSEEPSHEQSSTASALNINHGVDDDDTGPSLMPSLLERDPEAEAAWRVIEQAILAIPWPGDTRSRVLKDIFHVFQMIWISKAHGLRVTFSRTLRDAIFLPDPEDQRRMIAYLARLSPPTTWDECLQSNPRLIKRHCKFIVPPAEVVAPLVAKVFETYGPLKDAESGLPLFNAAAWKTAKNILVLVKSGYISDPPGLSLYHFLGYSSSSGLPIYQCFRGTNFTEGGVHRPIRHCMPLGGASPRHTVNRLLDFIFRHNMRVGTRNKTGTSYRGHFDPWLINQRQLLLNSEEVRSLVPASKPVAGWVNGDLYEPTTEVFGILPIPSGVQTASDILPYDPSDPPKKYAYLARRQGTRFAVLNVTTEDEKRAFSSKMRSNEAFSGEAGPLWARAVKHWNHDADGKTVFYKLEEHLKTQYSNWKRLTNVKHTKLATYDSRKAIDALVRNTTRRLEQAPSVVPSTTPSVSIPPTQGLRDEATRPKVVAPAPILSLRTSRQMSVSQKAGSSLSAAGDARNTPRSHPSETSSSRDAASTDSHDPGTVDVEEVQSPEIAAKAAESSNHARASGSQRIRTCIKCGKLATQCKGNSGVGSCRNACKDCGTLDCPGRDSRNRKKLCPTMSKQKGTAGDGRKGKQKQ
ncbi:hypothetical protein BDZ89DRAFT_1170255 [Hymenopellis radicata]|nr:hypothetical protein BDZ89DRAFT_1170255 [Hymenopellis radicata]